MTSPPRPFNRRVQTICLLILTLIALGVTLALLRPVLVPFVLALFFAECLEPVILLQVRHLHFPRVCLPSASPPFLPPALLTGIGFLIGASISAISSNLDAYRHQLDQSLQHLTNSRLLHWFGITPSATSLPEDKMIEFLSDLLGETRNFLSDEVCRRPALLLAFLLFGRHKNSRLPSMVS